MSENDPRPFLSKINEVIAELNRVSALVDRNVKDILDNPLVTSLPDFPGDKEAATQVCPICEANAAQIEAQAARIAFLESALREVVGIYELSVSEFCQSFNSVATSGIPISAAPNLAKWLSDGC